MNPIPTTNAMKPAPGKGISSYPTPVIKDTVIIEIVNAWKGDYTPLEYGTKWDDVPHASVQGNFPDHKLINQAPNSEDGQWVKRIWANDRIDQDTYNYAIKYSGGSDAHPIYIRTYIELRETYAPVPDLTPDPLFPNALLVEEQVDRESSELDSRYVKVTRTYETLPGPVIRSKRINDRGDTETVEVQTVPPTTQPDPDGLLVTQSQVILEDVSKGTKTTATVPSYAQLQIKENKDGLLGETVTTDDVVAPSTQPDALTQTIVSSVVQQTSATKAVKRTTTSSGPSSLSAVSLVDSPVGQVPASVIQSIVAPSTSASGGKLVIQDQISPIDSAKSRRETVTVPSYPELTTYDLDENLNVVVITEREVVDHNAPFVRKSLMLSSTDKPLDQWKTLRITSRMATLPPTRIEYKTQQFTFPALLERVVPNILNVGFGNIATGAFTSVFASGINKYVSIYPILRPAISLPTKVKITTEFFDLESYGSVPEPFTPYQITPQNVSFNGSLFSFNFGDVITDSVTVGPIAAEQLDQRFGSGPESPLGGLVEQVFFPQSIPSFSEYVAKANNPATREIVIFSEVEYIRSNIWTRVTGRINLI